MKPPVIDLTAREATDPAAPETEGTAAPAARPKASPRPPKPAAEPPAAPEPRDEKPEPPPPPPPPRPPARLAMPWSAISIAAVVGAVLGSALTYGLANWIALPDHRPAIADPAPALAALGTRDEALETRLAAVETGTRNAQVSLDATLAQFDRLGTELRQSIAEVRDAIPAAQAVDLAPLQQELQVLEDRVAAIAAGASSADAAALAQNLAAIEQSLTTLGSRLDAVEAGAASLAALRTEVDEAKAAIAAQSQTLGGTQIGPAVRLPLIVAGLESAITNGRPYAGELRNLTALLPDLAVPAPVTAAAETGLMRPDALAERFSAAIPDILAGRTAQPSGDWGKDALEWAKALLALRPVEEIPGDTPEAVVSRLEGAVKRHDFAAAATLLAQLPQPMQAAAGNLGAEIASHAAADAFIAGLRAQALDTAAVTAN